MTPFKCANCGLEMTYPKCPHCGQDYSAPRGAGIGPMDYLPLDVQIRVAEELRDISRKGAS